jgi:hypothetical protein
MGDLLGLAHRLEQILADFHQAVRLDGPVLNQAIELRSEHRSAGLACVTH